METFKIYEELDNIEISNFGNVKVNNELIEPTINKQGYYYIRVGEKYYSIHRMVAFMFVDRLNESFNVVDHIDNNRLNNHYTNLRWTSLKLNGKNKKCKNKFGVNGIYEMDDKYRIGKKIYKVVIGHENKAIKVGYFKDVNSAISARKQIEIELYGEYSKFYVSSNEISSTSP